MARAMSWIFVDRKMIEPLLGDFPARSWLPPWNLARKGGIMRYTPFSHQPIPLPGWLYISVNLCQYIPWYHLYIYISPLNYIVAWYSHAIADWSNSWLYWYIVSPVLLVISPFWLAYPSPFLGPFSGRTAARRLCTKQTEAFCWELTTTMGMACRDGTSISTLW